MKKDILIKKWLADELSEQELKTFKASEDYEFNLRLIEAAKNFKASYFITTESYDNLEQQIQIKRDACNCKKLHHIKFRKSS